jgi:hypothetical protein
MRSAVIIFHKNIFTRYPKEWIDQCYSSIKGQTYQDFDVFELDYGGDNNYSYEGSRFYSENLDNHALSHNYLLDIVFGEGYDCAFNVNVDDWYDTNRFSSQIAWIEKGYDVVSSNFYRVNEDGLMISRHTFHNMDMVKEADKNHNILAHPVLCYSRNFWTNCDKLDPKDIPADDFILWKKSYKKGCFKFVVIPEYLLYQRIHDINVSKKGIWKQG